MQMGSEFYYCTSWLLYMFWALLAPIIRSTTTVYAASGTSTLTDDRFPTWQSINTVYMFILCHVGKRSSVVYLCQRLHIQLLCSWWWVQEAPEICRVVKKCSNKIHCPAASCWFIKYFLISFITIRHWSVSRAK